MLPRRTEKLSPSTARISFPDRHRFGRNTLTRSSTSIAISDTRDLQGPDCSAPATANTASCRAHEQGLRLQAATSKGGNREGSARELHWIANCQLLIANCRKNWGMPI